MENISYKLEDGTLTVFVSGRIDSSNAQEFDSELELIRTNNAHNALVLDAENLEYTSSAGLRAILRVLKLEPGMKIINASSEVYDIFEMTGFTELMTIQKAYRHISVEGAELIGQGATGKVYRTAPDTIVKVYFDSNSLSDIEREIKMARRAFVLGIPTAIPFDIVKVGDNFGSVFEMLNADSFAKCVINDPNNIDKYIDLSVDLMKKIHHAEVKPEEMADQKAVFRKRVDFAKDYLSKERYEKLSKMYEAIPESNHMLHGDLHFKNMMMQNGEVLLIDMDTLCHGDPIFEFASIYDAYLGFSEFDHENIHDFLGITYEQGQHVWQKTVEDYFETKDENRIKEITEKVQVLSHLRLFHHIITHGLDIDEEHKKQRDGYLRLLEKAIDDVDNLIL